MSEASPRLSWWLVVPPEGSLHGVYIEESKPNSDGFGFRAIVTAVRGTNDELRLIVRAVNSHEKLVKALQAMLSRVAGNPTMIEEDEIELGLAALAAAREEK